MAIDGMSASITPVHEVIEDYVDDLHSILADQPCTYSRSGTGAVTRRRRTRQLRRVLRRNRGEDTRQRWP